MRRAGLAVLVLVVLGVVYLAAWRTQPATPRPLATPSAVSAAVTSITRTCPPPAPNTGSAHISMIALPDSSAAKTATSAVGAKVPTGTVALSAVPAVPVPGNPGKPAKGSKPAKRAATPATSTAPA